MWILIGTLSLVLGQCRIHDGFEINNHVIFSKLREVSVSKSHWDIVLLLELDYISFPGLLTDIREQLGRVQEMAQHSGKPFKLEAKADLTPLLHAFSEIEEQVLSLSLGNNSRLPPTPRAVRAYS